MERQTVQQILISSLTSQASVLCLYHELIKITSSWYVCTSASYAFTSTMYIFISWLYICTSYLYIAVHFYVFNMRHVILYAQPMYKHRYHYIWTTQCQLNRIVSWYSIFLYVISRPLPSPPPTPTLSYSVPLCSTSYFLLYV